MIETLLIVISRSAPAMSAPRPNAPFTTARNEKRKSATANEPTVRIRRIFLRKRFAKMRLLNFTRHLRQMRYAARCRLRLAILSRDAARDRRAWRRRGRG